MNNTEKIITIGIDGGTWNIITPLIKAGKLPTFKKLMKNGASGIMKSIPPLSAPAWSSITTGKTIENHGIFSFASRNYYYDLKPLTSTDKQAPDFWEYLEDPIIINIPFSYPVEPTAKLMISGMLSPSISKKSVYPPSEIKYLKENEYIIEPKKSLESIKKSLIRKVKAMFHYMNKYEWQLFFIVFREFDPLQHYYWEEAPKYYIFMDNVLSLLLSKLDKHTNLFIISDHGFNRVNKVFHIKNWLKNKTYMKPKETHTNKQPFSSIFRELASKIINPELKTELLKREVLSKLKFFLPFQFLNSNKRKKKNKREENILYKDSKVLPGSWGALYLNRINRFKNGFLKDKHAEEIKQKLESQLRSLKDKKTEKKIIKYVKDFSHIKGFPEIFFYQNCEEGYSTTYVEKEANKILFPGNEVQKKGDHTENAIFIGWGPNIKNVGKFTKNIQLTDLTPTFLKILNSKVKTKFDGEILYDILK